MIDDDERAQTGGPMTDDTEPDAEQELRDALAAIWVKDDLTGWPEWDADGSYVHWGDGDAVAQTWENCMHAHGTKEQYARFIAAADPAAIHDLLAELDRLRLLVDDEVTVKDLDREELEAKLAEVQARLAELDAGGGG